MACHLKQNAERQTQHNATSTEQASTCEDAHMQINNTLKALKNANNNVISFSIASIANSTLAILASLTNLTNKSQSNNREPRLEPVCWQCGTARGLLKVHTAEAEHFVCHSCGGEQ